jgi:hypothetical protein
VPSADSTVAFSCSTDRGTHSPAHKEPDHTAYLSTYVRAYRHSLGQADRHALCSPQHLANGHPDGHAVCSTHGHAVSSA